MSANWFDHAIATVAPRMIPVLSIKRCSGPCDPRNGMLTFRVFWRRLRV
ncbi:hypothetical protein SAMN04244567_04158, partial [Paracoccus pantotrophus]